MTNENVSIASQQFKNITEKHRNDEVQLIQLLELG
jgi:hypothetical protein